MFPAAVARVAVEVKLSAVRVDTAGPTTEDRKELPRFAWSLRPSVGAGYADSNAAWEWRVAFESRLVDWTDPEECRGCEEKMVS